MSSARAVLAATLTAAVACAALVHAGGFGGFFVGDDLGNLWLVHSWAAEGRLWERALAYFGEGVMSQGAFYRPLMVLSLAASYAASGTQFAGWYAPGFLAHLANTALVGLLVARLSRAGGAQGAAAPLLAALLFGTSPFLTEGVYWASARADAFVTFLGLLGLYLWAGAPDGRGTLSAAWLPLMLVPALAFKESAALIPFQVALVAIAWPSPVGRRRVVALVAAFALVAAYLALRAHLFGNPWVVYRGHGTTGAEALAARVGAGLLSVGPWWSALSAGAGGFAVAYPYLLALAIAALAVPLGWSGPRARLAAAFAAAAAGLFLATMANLGSLPATGEGGRLNYGPFAWLAIALGIAATPPAGQRAPAPWRERLRLPGLALLATAIASGFAGTHAIVTYATSAQQGLRALVASLPAWTQAHPGLTLLVVPDSDRHVVVSRNGQGSIASPPLQAAPLLDRVLPTLPSDIGPRYDEFRSIAGYWPAHYACWSVANARIMGLPEPSLASRNEWVATLGRSLAACAP